MNRWLLLVATPIGLSVLLGTPGHAPSQEKIGIDKLKATDAYGDPLPKGVVARLGTLRWRNPEGTLAFSPDGKYLAAAGGPTKLFDASSGRLLRCFKAHSSFLAFSPDGRTLVTASEHTVVVRFWDVSTGKERRNFQLQGGTNFGLPCYSADCKRLACYNISYVDPNEKRFVSIWDLETGKEIRKWLDLKAGSIYFSPDGKTFVLPFQTHYFLNDADTGKEKARIPFPPSEAFGNTLQTKFLAFASDGKMLAGLGKGHVYLWDTGTGKVVHRLALPNEDAESVAISANDRVLAAGGRKGTLYLWDLGSRKLLHAIPAPAGRDLPIYILALAPDGKKVACQQHITSWIRMWDVAGGRELSDFDETMTGVERVAFAQDGKSVFSLPAGGPICKWDLITGKLQREIGANGLREVAVTFRGPVSDGTKGELRLRSDGKTIVKTFNSGDELKIGVWQDGKQGQFSSFKVGMHNLGLRELVLSPDGKRAAGLGSDGRGDCLIAWDIARGQEIRRFRLPGYTRSGVAFSADGRTLVTNYASVGRWSKIVFSFWELATGNQRKSLEYELRVIPALPAVLFHDRLAAMSDDETVTLIDLSTGKEFGRFQSDDGYVSCMAFSKDGRYLASGSRDSTVLIWNLAALQKEVATAKLSEKELADHWDELAGANSVRAYQAIRRLSAARDQAVTYLSQRLPSAPHVSKERIQALIADLDSKTFAKRDKATQELVSLHGAAEALLREALKGNSSLELRQRVESILQKQSERPTRLSPLGPGEELQAIRAVEVLEMIGTPPAQAVLSRLAKGAPQALLTREAQASLGRVGRLD